MKVAVGLGIALGGLVVSASETLVQTEHLEGAAGSASFKFKSVPSPVKGDRAEKAKITLLRGNTEVNGGGVAKLNDGELPREEDAPSANFFLVNRGTSPARLVIDLRDAVEVERVSSFSWHPGGRGPQRYTLHGSLEPVDGAASALTRLAEVTTRKSGAEPGGQHAASVTAKEGALGKFRFLIFDIEAGDKEDVFGQTFFSEIDVIAKGDMVEPIGAPERHETVVTTGEGKYHIIVDTTDAPELREWVEKELSPVIKDWYPKLVQMLPSPGYEAPTRVTIHFDPKMRGVAAASGSRIRGSAQWYKDNLKGEATGSIVHELVHVVQSYGQARRNNPNATRTPGWIVEGIPDYLRWFVYEPQTKGAEITARNFERAKYDANYRISANFLNWVVERHGKEIIPNLNAVARQGKYTPEFWTEHTGKTVEELGAAWKADHAKRLGID
ncbi:MAG TPA: basic secretory protein-like protein [Methylomirabilota bacterium]|nr:basic secretory protein-like protein [Methylomirabilota bacterium]